MSDPRDEDTIRRWQNYTRSGAAGADDTRPELPLVVTDDTAPGPAGVREGRAPSALVLGLLGIVSILVLAAGVAFLVNGPGGGFVSRDDPPVNGRPADVPESNGAPAPSRNLTQEFTRILAAEAPLQIGLGDESGQRITSEPEHLVDGDPGTAWRVEGDGTQQQIVIRLGGNSSLDVPEAKTVTEVGLINGFAAGSHYADGRKILAVRWDFGGGQVVNQTFRSSEQMQLVPLPRALSTDRVELTITEVGPASTTYDDYTAISELEIRGY